MVALRWLGLIALVVWVGGMIALGSVAAPAAFDVLTARVPDAGRVLAGAVVGEMLQRLQHVAYTCGLVLLGVLIGRALLGPRPVRFAIRVGVVIVMLAISAYSGFAITTRIQAIQREIGGGSPSVLPESDARRVEFGRLHALSTGLMVINIFGGLVLLLFEARE